MNRKILLNKIEEIQKFIEDNNAKDNHGRLLKDFDKLCFVQEDLTKLKEEVIHSSQP